MLFKELKSSLKTKIENCYILSCGKDKEDIFLKSSCINNLKNAIIKGQTDFNLNVFTTENISANGLKNALNTLPFFSERKMVLIKENEPIKDKEIIDCIANFLSNIVQTTVLVIDKCEESGLESLTKLNGVTVVDCQRVDREILRAFILKRCREEQFKIDENAINCLIDFCDGYMTRISIELDKLISFKFQEKSIFEFDVLENVNKSDEYQIFELTNAISNKNSEKALFIVDDIIKNKKNVSAILSLIYSQIRRLFYVKISKESNAELAKSLEIKEYAVKMLKLQAEKMSAKKLKEMLYLCKNTDYGIKSGNLDLISGIYNLVFSLLT